jgi:MFS family permease
MAVGPAPVSRGYANYVLGLLFLVYVFNFIDRQVLAILLEAIKHDLGASDTAMGFLSGFAFAVFYTVAGIPIARWADRGSRRTIIALGLGVWSTMTVGCGLARSFTELALARVGVGVGEAAGSPPAHSLISDYFPPERRATALSIYATGVYVGAMLAYVGGGYLVTAFDWRTAFFLVGLPGIPLALLVRLTVRELPRGGGAPVHVVARGEAPIGIVRALRYLAGRRSFVYLAAGASCASLGGYAILAWGPTFLARVHAMESVEIGTWLGLAIGVGGSAGAYLGGTLADRLARRDTRWYMWISAASIATSVPFALGFLLLEHPGAALAAFVPFYVLANVYIGPMLWTTQSIVPPHMRATASAVLLFILNMVGLGAGPLLVGFLNDQLAVRMGGAAIRYSLAGTALVGTAASGCFWVASRWVRQDLASVDWRIDSDPPGAGQ